MRPKRATDQIMLLLRQMKLVTTYFKEQVKLQEQEKLDLYNLNIATQTIQKLYAADFTVYLKDQIARRDRGVGLPQQQKENNNQLIEFASEMKTFIDACQRNSQHETSPADQKIFMSDFTNSPQYKQLKSILDGIATPPTPPSRKRKAKVLAEAHAGAVAQPRPVVVATLIPAIEQTPPVVAQAVLSPPHHVPTIEQALVDERAVVPRPAAAPQPPLLLKPIALRAAPKVQHTLFNRPPASGLNAGSTEGPSDGGPQETQPTSFTKR